MATHDYNIANQTAPSFRTDLNNALLAIVSVNSGGSAPSTTFANQLWYDTSANQLKMRNEANSNWIVLLESDQTNNRVNLITDDIQYATSAGTEVKNTSGTTVLSLKVPTQSTAETGTETTQVMTPLRTKQSIQANAITSVVAGSGISVSTSSGAATVTNSFSVGAGQGLDVSGSTISMEDSFLENVSGHFTTSTTSFTNNRSFPVLVAGRRNSTSSTNFTVNIGGSNQTLDMQDGDGGTFDNVVCILPVGATVSNGDGMTLLITELRPG